MKAVEDVLRDIGRMPLAHSIVHGDIRRAVVTGFPYVVYFRAESKCVRVIAVIHGKRDPSIWQSRK